MDNDHKRLLLNTPVVSPAAPGGTLSDDMTRTEFCLFTAQEDLETMQAYAQVANTASSLRSRRLQRWNETPNRTSRCCFLTCDTRKWKMLIVLTTGF